jgi:hypothetical protein
VGGGDLQLFKLCFNGTPFFKFSFIIEGTTENVYKVNAPASQD